MIQSIQQSPLISSLVRAVRPPQKNALPQLSHAVPRVQDKLQINAPKGMLPISIGLFSSSAISNALNDLNQSPTELNFRQSEAHFRVSIRSLSTSDLSMTEKQLAKEMGQTSDYRTQIFLDKLSFDIKMERLDRNLSQAQVGEQRLESNSPAGMVKETLALLLSNPTEANFRQARANFRVSTRDLDTQGLKQAMNVLQATTGQTSDYRTQVFLATALMDTRIELAWKDPSYTHPQPTMPEPLVGSTGAEMTKSALGRLASQPTQANFKGSQAAFRVAIRSLDLSQLNDAEKAIKAAMGQTNDYRTQVFLDKILGDIRSEVFDRNRS